MSEIQGKLPRCSHRQMDDLRWVQSVRLRVSFPNAILRTHLIINTALLLSCLLGSPFIDYPGTDFILVML